MTVALATQPSTAPLPTGDAAQIRGTGAGTLAWPANGAPFLADGGSTQMKLGVFTKPWRYWLIACGNLIMYESAATWTRADFALRLLDQNGATVSDLNGINFFQKICVRDNEGGGWYSYTCNAHFFCEASLQYQVQMFSMSASPAGVNYYSADVHLSLFAHTIGEGVY